MRFRFHKVRIGYIELVKIWSVQVRLEKGRSKFYVLPR